MSSILRLARLGEQSSEAAAADRDGVGSRLLTGPDLSKLLTSYIVKQAPPPTHPPRVVPF